MNMIVRIFIALIGVGVLLLGKELGDIFSINDGSVEFVIKGWVAMISFMVTGVLIFLSPYRAQIFSWLLRLRQKWVQLLRELEARRRVKRTVAR